MIREATATANKFMNVAQIAVALSGAIGFYEAMAVNALGCVITNFGEQARHFVNAFYYATYSFGLHDKLYDELAKYYPEVCTCKLEVDKMARKAEGVSDQLEEIFEAFEPDENGQPT